MKSLTDKSLRYGKLVVDKSFYYNIMNTSTENILLKYFYPVIINDHDDTIEFHGYSIYFDQITTNEIPIYEIDTKTIHGETFVSFNRVG